MCFLYRLRGMPSKRRLPRNRSHSGVLSNRECGGWTSQPPVMNASIQCSPERSMLHESALNTWCTRKSRHTRSMAYTERLKCAASEASATALTAPAEVPVMMGKGHADPRRIRRKPAGSGQLQEIREFVVLHLSIRRHSAARRAQVLAHPERQQECRA